MKLTKLYLEYVCFSALVQFFALFPELKDNDFYITGEVSVNVVGHCDNYNIICLVLLFSLHTLALFIAFGIIVIGIPSSSSVLVLIFTYLSSLPSVFKCMLNYCIVLYCMQLNC